MQDKLNTFASCMPYCDNLGSTSLVPRHGDINGFPSRQEGLGWGVDAINICLLGY